MKVKAYDLDGTLVKLPVDWALLRKHLNQEYGVDWFYELEEPRKTEALGFIRKTELESLERPVRINEKLCAKILEESTKGVKQAIFSMNCRETVEKCLENTGIRNAIGFTIALEDVSEYKPNPQGLEKILEHFNEKPSQASYYGDKKLDEQAAKAIGVKFVKVNF